MRWDAKNAWLRLTWVTPCRPKSRNRVNLFLFKGLSDKQAATYVNRKLVCSVICRKCLTLNPIEWHQWGSLEILIPEYGLSLQTLFLMLLSYPCFSTKLHFNVPLWRCTATKKSTACMPHLGPPMLASRSWATPYAMASSSIGQSATSCHHRQQGGQEAQYLGTSAF
jgi:hypothetical protein